MVLRQIYRGVDRRAFSEPVFVFSGRRDDIIKELRRSGDGLCLLAKQLEHGRFVYAADGVVTLTQALRIQVLLRM
jgi:transposase